MFEMIMTVDKWENIYLKQNRKIVLQITEMKFSYLECVFSGRGSVLV